MIKATTFSGSLDWPVVFTDPTSSSAPIRLLVACQAWTATQQISFLEALRRWREAGAATLTAFDEQGLAAVRRHGGIQAVKAFIELQMDRVRPTALVLSRYAGPDYPQLLEAARRRGVPVVYHLDDDVFEVPIALGVDVYAQYRQPRRIQAVHRIAEAVDVVYVSTPALGRRVMERCRVKSLVVADVYAGADALEPLEQFEPPKSPGEIRIGYMGSATHTFDLEETIPALHSIIRRYPQVTLHLFGSIIRTPAARELAAYATMTPRCLGSYRDFRNQLAELGWDIGLVPLRPDAFNICKAPTKWIEYAEARMAVLASDGPVYKPMADAGAARLCRSDQWEQALEELIVDAEMRAGLVRKASRLLAESFSWRRVERQIVDLLLNVETKSETGINAASESAVSIN